MNEDWLTPFEQGNGNRTTTWAECIGFYSRLSARFADRLRLEVIGSSDSGLPIHAGVWSIDGDFDPASVRRAGRSVVFNNNGIHPGEPEGIDVCMALVRDACLQPERLGSTVLLFVPVYNVDGACDRGDGSRVNQVGPEQFGFRGTARHLDLNRDFIKAASRSAGAFARLFSHWDPDVLVDTHTSNGADYQHVLTLIATQPDKLGGALGPFLRERMLPALYQAMQARDWPMCPYVNTVGEIPDDGIADFIDSPRYSTGYAALHHTLGFMPETHMLKSFAQRYGATRAFIDSVLDFVAAQGAQIQALRAQDRTAWAPGAWRPLDWVLDATRSSRLRFLGYRALRAPSRLGHYQRLRYDRSQPFEADIAHFDRCIATAQATLPLAYLLPQAWPEVAQRLATHGVQLLAVAQEGVVDAEVWRIAHFEKSPQPFEGQHLHTRVEVEAEALRLPVRAGDWLVPLGTAHDRLVFEVLEPLGMDSLFRWGFFDAVLDRKETFSDYVFEDEAERLLEQEPALRAAFTAWKAAHPELLGDAQAVLGFLHRHAQRHAEPAWRRYPVARIVDAQALRALQAGTVGA